MFENEYQYCRIDDGTPLGSEGLQRYNNQAEIKYTALFAGMCMFLDTVGGAPTNYCVAFGLSSMIGYFLHQRKNQKTLSDVFGDIDDYCLNKNPQELNSEHLKNAQLSVKYLEKLRHKSSKTLPIALAIFLSHRHIPNETLSNIAMIVGVALLYEDIAETKSYSRHRKVQSHEWVIDKASTAQVEETHPSILQKFLDSVKHVYDGSRSPVPAPVPTQSVAVSEQDLS